MRSLRSRAVITLATSIAVATVALAETTEEMRNRILASTQVVAVTELAVPAAEYKGDGDPNTLEIVFLKKKKDGPSRVSDDGEVIFLYKASDATQQELITRAFEIRFAKAAGGT